MTRARLISVAGAALLTWIAFAGDASAKARGPVFSLAIGYNGLPPSAETELTPLRYADDDAVAFHQFARTFTRRSFLLAILDAETQARFPTLASEVRPPSRADLEKVLAELEGAVDGAMAAGEEPSVLIFYSGHGGRAENGQAALTLSDGLLTKDALYATVLAPLRTVFVHLFVDACNAEAVVRPRDAQAQVVDPTAEDVSVAFQKATLAGFPRVGALVASTAGAQAHEWDVYQSGIFTHEVLSALRGAADVDGNHRIEYSEIAAFLSAANREVSDPRARPHMVVHPPPLDRRAPIVDLDGVRGAAFLEGRVLMVRERSDGLWTLPGGWCDVNDSPSESVVKEIQQESGFEARAVKLAAVLDRRKHPHPTQFHHVYKLYFLCELTGGEAQSSIETDAVGFFAEDELPPLSVNRITQGQIELMFRHERERDLPTTFD